MADTKVAFFGGVSVWADDTFLVKMNGSTWKIEDLLHQIEEVYRKEGMLEFWPGERPHVKTALEAISLHLPASRYAPNVPDAVLGVGGSGIVLRLKDQLFPQIDNALKFPRPVSGKIKLVAEMLAKEMSKLTELRHPGIVRILCYAILADIPGYGDLPFYLMEAVDGVKSEKLVKDPRTSEAQFLELVSKTAEIIFCLHSHPSGGFAQLDIKPENVVVGFTGRPIMIDLGTCKQLSADENTTTVACVKPSISTTDRARCSASTRMRTP